MAENEKTLNEEVQPQPQASEPKKGSKAGAAVKEWFRKQIVALKRAPQRIPLVFMVIVTFIWLIWLFTFSQAIDATAAVEWTGPAVFVNTLLSILVLALFLSAFPKRKKANKVMVAMLFVFLILIILCDVLYYVQESAYLNAQEDSFVSKYPFLESSLTLAIAHIVLNAISIVLIATLPLYRKLILKINTKKVVEENKIVGTIDTSAEV